MNVDNPFKAWIRSPSQTGPSGVPWRPCSAYLSYRHQFLSNRPKNWAPDISRAYLYKSDEFFVIWMIYLTSGWVLSGRLGSGWGLAGFGANPAETQPGRWVVGWAARNFDKVFQNITSSLRNALGSPGIVFTRSMMLRIQFGWFDLEDLIGWTASYCFKVASPSSITHSARNRISRKSRISFFSKLRKSSAFILCRSVVHMSTSNPENMSF